MQLFEHRGQYLCRGVAGWKPRRGFQLNKCRKRLRHGGDRYSIQLHSCQKTSKKGTPMKGPMNAKSTKRRMLKAGAVAVTLVAVLAGSTGCTLSCTVPAAGQVTCS
jgi:hypothetical protein